MSNLMNVVLLAVVVASISGCFKYTIKTGNGGDVGGTPDKSEWTLHFIDGLVGEGGVDVQAICNGPNATIKIERNVVDAIIANATGVFLVQPSHIDVYCGDQRVSQLPVDKESARRIAATDEFLDIVAEARPEMLEAVTAADAR
jgi:hypothetical protein